MKCCFFKKSIPSKSKPTKRIYTYKANIIDTYLEESIPCGTCNVSFSLRDNQLLAICGGCDKFMHCGIAGSCIGPNCTHIIGDEVYRQTWCKECVPKTVIINLEHMGPGQYCLCQECLDDPKTPSCHKRKI